MNRLEIVCTQNYIYISKNNHTARRSTKPEKPPTWEHKEYNLNDYFSKNKANRHVYNTL